MMKSIYLSPERRRQLISRLERAVDDPRLSADQRKSAERHLRNQKAMQRWEASATRH